MSAPEIPDSGPASNPQPQRQAYRLPHSRRSSSSGTESAVIRPAPPLYRALDLITQVIICFLVLCGSWCFAPVTLSLDSYYYGYGIHLVEYGFAALCGLVGLCFLLKAFLRRLAGYAPPRWGRGRSNGLTRGLVRGLAVLTLIPLLYTLVSALNARAEYDFTLGTFDYFDHYLDWLPHTYFQTGTWRAFFSYFAFGLFFWALRDWLITKTVTDQRMAETLKKDDAPAGLFIPQRLRWLLLFLSYNGGLIALEGIFQRQAENNALLWIWETHFPEITQFGPFVYYGTASQYLNLIWPVALGVWWGIQRQAERLHQRGGRHHALLGCIMLMAAAPIIANTRGGSLVALGNMILCAVVLLWDQKRTTTGGKLKIIAVLGLTVALAGFVGWSTLSKRFEREDQLSDRTPIWQNTQQIINEHPLFGTGPMSFMPIYRLYRESPSQISYYYAHNDYLETLANFGWVGAIPIFLALIWAWLRPWAPGGIPTHGVLLGTLRIALLGCLIHAAFDFPMQVFSTLHLFLVLACVMFCISRDKGEEGREN